MKLIVGLGNPGKEYEETRHNVGFMVIDNIINKEQLTINPSKKFSADIAQQKTDQKEILYIKPQTFMNNSDIAVRALLAFYKLTPLDIIVIHDEKDIPLGEYKIQTNRGAAGHNGVQSIIDHLGTKNFTRIRVGIGPENKKVDYIEEFVMGKFSEEEKRTLKQTIEQVTREVKNIINFT